MLRRLKPCKVMCRWCHMQVEGNLSKYLHSQAKSIETANFVDFFCSYIIKL